MGKNIVESGRPLMTVRRMRLACWIPKATNTNSEFVILIAFKLQQWLHERAWMLHYMYIARHVRVLCGFMYFLLFMITLFVAYFSNIISRNSISWICGNKMPSRYNRWFLLQILLLAQHVSGTTMPIIRSSRVLYRWLLPVVFGALMMGIMMPETCWASNKT